MIVCCGEALIDMLPGALADGNIGFAVHPGGAALNTAIALGRLGSTVGLFAGVSTDLFGKRLTCALEESHVTTKFLVRSERPTTLAFVELSNGDAQYAFYDENTAGRMLTPDDLPDLTGVDALLFGGISLVEEPCGSTFEALMERETSRCVTMIDLNIRPSFIQDESAYRMRIDHMVSMVDIVKVSDEDLQWLDGSTDSESMAKSLLEKGPKLVCLTQGSKGVTAYSRNENIHVPAQNVAVADTVGAGDTFNAGMLAELQSSGALTKKHIANLKPAEIEAALTLGVLAAAITVSRAGSNPPWRKELPRCAP